MTKKAQKIIEEFNKRIEIRCYTRIKEERDDVESLITNMFRYSLLSENDFNELWQEVHFTGAYTFEKVLDLIYK